MPGKYEKFNLDIPKMGDTILVRSEGGLFGRGIEFKQRKAGFSKEHAQYTHVEISGGGHRSMRIAPPKATRIDITKVYAGRYIKIRRYKVEDWDRRRKHVAWVHATLCNTGYDKEGILNFIFKWIRQRISRWFCSEGWLFAHQKEIPAALDYLIPSQCMPAHAAASDELEDVWEGHLPQLPSKK